MARLAFQNSPVALWIGRLRSVPAGCRSRAAGAETQCQVNFGIQHWRRFALLKAYRCKKWLEKQ
jgi:hypothetical protein